MISKIISLIFLIMLLPVFIMISLLIIISDGFPVFFKQKRVGVDNSNFWIYKFRTMKKNTPDIPTHLIKDRHNLYISVGPFLRKYSMDELPQLINIFKGELCFIGPRPSLYNQEDLIRLRTQKGISKIMPGITGWSQVNGRDELSIEEKVEKDYYYLLNKSLVLDIKIIILTLIKVLKTEDVSF